MVKRFIPIEIETVVTYDPLTSIVSAPYHIATGAFEEVKIVEAPKKRQAKPKPAAKGEQGLWNWEVVIDED